MEKPFTPIIKGIVFDMDGLMFDTERIYLKVWIESGKSWGLGDISAIGVGALGMNTALAEKYWKKELGPDVDFIGFMDFYRKNYAEYRSSHTIPVKKGLLELLLYLKEKGYKIAVASSTKRETVLQYLKETHILSYFDAIIGGDMVTHSKPDPEIYEIACRELGLPAENCMALEDSFNGIRSAKAAKLLPVMIPDILQPTEEISALFFRKLEDLHAVIPLLEELTHSLYSSHSL